MRLIDADALEMRMEERLNALRKEYGNYDHYTDGFDEGCVAVEDAETVDAEPVRHGEWLVADTPFVRQRKCSLCRNCDNPKTAVWGHYCWACGAKMDGGKQDAD